MNHPEATAEKRRSASTAPAENIWNPAWIVSGSRHLGQQLGVPIHVAMHHSILAARITSRRAKPQTRRQPWSPRASLSRAAKPQVGHESPWTSTATRKAAKLYNALQLLLDSAFYLMTQA